MILKVVFNILLPLMLVSCGPAVVEYSSADAADAGEIQGDAALADHPVGDAVVLSDAALRDNTAQDDQGSYDANQPDSTVADSSSGSDAATQNLGLQPSNGSGGTIAAGQIGTWSVSSGSGSVIVRIPASYDPQHLASPVVFLFNEEINQWAPSAEDDALIIVDLDEYNDISAYNNKIDFAMEKIAAEYNVDLARYYLAGWSAGGNIVMMIAGLNQNLFAASMVFPGTGGQESYNDLQIWTGHKSRFYYACGSEDPNYPWDAVQNEANAFAGLGYTTRFDKVEGAAHYIDEAVYHIRSAAWQWVRGFNLQN